MQQKLKTVVKQRRIIMLKYAAQSGKEHLIQTALTSYANSCVQIQQRYILDWTHATVTSRDAMASK